MTARSDSVVKEIILEKKSKTKKEKKLRLYMHPPSIPTRFQTIHYDDGESRGFNSTSKRFTIRVSELPGPGYYAKAAEGLEPHFSVASISKRGYGVGFASQSRRFKNTLTNLSPAKYKPLTPTYSQSLSHSKSPAFKKPIFASADLSGPVVRTKTGIKATPGPGEYAAEKVLAGSKKQAAESVFKSKSSRYMPATTTINKKPDQKVDQAPTNSKTIEKEKPINPTSSFKASSRQYHDKPKTGPSIGQYDVVEKKIPRAITKPPIRLQTIAKPPAKPVFPASIQTSVPGSGATPIAFPSPGRYNLAKGAEMMSQHRQAPAPSLGKSQRFVEMAFDALIPGPGSYKPFIDGGHRSFHLNLHGNWT